MNITAYTYLIPLLLAVILIFRFLKINFQKYGRSTVSFVKKGNFAIQEYALSIIRRLIGRDSSLYRLYSAGLLKYSNTSVELLFEIKLILFIAVMVLSLMVKFTDIKMQTAEIYQKFDYKVDMLFERKEVKDQSKALEQEIDYFGKALQKIDKEELSRSPEDVQTQIKNLIQEKESALMLSKDTLANKIYYRLKDYYAVRKMNFPLYVLEALLISFCPEMYFLIKNIFTKADARNELRFLKKLIIMNGSIPPVDFMKVLDCLIDKSRYYKNILEEIRENNLKNSVDTREVYTRYIKQTKDITVKLFFEKLDEANNYDFKQAVTNIENEFRLEKREAVRNVRKRIEVIHIAGVMGFMLIIAILTIYLIMPWMSMYNTNQTGF